MESTRPIRALTRGLDALTVLNAHDGASVSEVAREIRLPRTTVYRILETLCDTGFVFRDPADDRYRVTIRVGGLSSGFRDEPWIARVAAPCIHDLCREIVWPVAIVTQAHGAMLVREATDHSTPLGTERLSAGTRMPLLKSAAGRAYLAFCPADEREAALTQPTQSQPTPARAELDQALADIKSRGYAVQSGLGSAAGEVTIALPVFRGNSIFAVLTVKFSSSWVPLATGLERFVPKIRHCAARMVDLLSELQVEVQPHARHAPAVAV